MSAALLLFATLTATSPGPSMLIARGSHTATLLDDGRVLVCGGHVSELRCEIYDPATRMFHFTGPMSTSRYIPTATKLLDGRVLVAGGGVYPDVRGLPFGTWGNSSAEIFDPKTETFTATQPMIGSRYSHAAALLRDGRVLVSGGGSGYVSGFSVSLHPQTGNELFDPAMDAFTPAPPMRTHRWEHTATRLLDDSVLLAGRMNFYYDEPAPPSAEIVSADGNSIMATGSTNAAAPGHTATLLRDGRVLIAGAGQLELYDPRTGTFSPAGTTSMNKNHTATLLADGRVLLTGGEFDGPANNIELFDPSTRRVTLLGSLRSPRTRHRAVLLGDGSVLIIGGRTENWDFSTTTEIYPAQPSRRRRSVR